MSDPWLLLNSGSAAPAWNMALDEALLEACGSFGRPVLRFYGWSEPAATFGYFQRHAEIAALISLRPLLRRPTGGGLVPHAADWTYSVAIPPGHHWHALRATESYRRIHEWLREAFTKLGLKTELAPGCDPTGAGQCFGGGWEQSDLLHAGRKLAGAAQRRNKLGLLVQGSVQPLPSGVQRAHWERAMMVTGAQASGIVWETLTESPHLLARARDLAERKYELAEHNDRR